MKNVKSYYLQRQWQINLSPMFASQLGPIGERSLEVGKMAGIRWRHPKRATFATWQYRTIGGCDTRSQRICARFRLSRKYSCQSEHRWRAFSRSHGGIASSNATQRQISRCEYEMGEGLQSGCTLAGTVTDCINVEPAIPSYHRGIGYLVGENWSQYTGQRTGRSDRVAGNYDRKVQ